jgi:hypothetical protein
MHPKQLALIESALDAVVAECLRSPVATLEAGHLRTLLTEHFLRAGAGVLERGATSAEGRLLRLRDEVVKVERVRLERRERTGGRPPRLPDLRLADPIALGLDLWARSTLAAAGRLAPRALHERLDALAAGTSDVLLLACDRRAYDALRVERAAEGGQPPVLARLCAALLPPSATLGDERTSAAPSMARRSWRTLAVMTPMVFGAQRVVVALWPAQRPVTEASAAPQLDAFEGA